MIVLRGEVAFAGWRLYDCERLGGSWPVDLPDFVDLDEGLTLGARIASVQEGDLTYAATEVIRLRDDRQLGIGVWIAGDGLRPEAVGAVNDVARRYSPPPGQGSASDRASQAARSCYRGGAG